PFHGSTGGMRLNPPIVGMAATADGNGYWLVASDGGIFTFGDATFHGSTGGGPPPLPLRALGATPGGPRDRGVAGGGPPALPVRAMAATPDGLGYWTVTAGGRVFAFGDAAFGGSAPPPARAG